MRLLLTAVSRFEKPSGICRYANNIANALVLASPETEVTLAVAPWQVDYYRNGFHWVNERVKIHEVGGLINGARQRNHWYMYGLPELSKQTGAAVTHLSYPIPVRHKGFDSAVVTTIHDLYPYDIPENFGFPKVYLNRLALWKCLREVDAVAAVSHYTLSRLDHYFPGSAKKKRIVGSPIAEVMGETLTRPAQLPEGFGPFLLTVAQHRKNKNVDVVLKAFAKLHHAGKAKRLIVVGSQGPETAKIDALTKELKLKSAVVYLRGLPDPELNWLYRECDALIIASSIEGFCYPIIEAERYGTRIVASDIPILRETGSERVEFFPLEGDAPANLANGIQQALARPPGAAGFIKPEFVPKTVGRIYLELYDRLGAAAEL